MIMYNNRYRGPYEYDKFMFNILSLHNVLESLETVEIRGTVAEITTLKTISEEVNKVFEKIRNVNEEAFILAIKERECING